MKILIKLSVIVIAPLAFLVAGCSNDANQPSTVKQQQEMARGHQPTKEELASAMSRFKTPTAAPPAPTP